MLGGPKLVRRTYTTPFHSQPGAIFPIWIESVGPINATSLPASPRVTSTSKFPETLEKAFSFSSSPFSGRRTRNDSSASSSVSPVLTTVRGSAHFSRNSTGPASLACNETRAGTAAARQREHDPSFTGKRRKSGSRKSSDVSKSFVFLSPPSSFSLCSDCLPHDDGPSAARNVIPESSVTHTAVTATGWPRFGQTSMATSCQVFGFNTSGTFVETSFREYVVSENSTETEATETSNGNDHFTPAVNLAGSPGTARVTQKPPTH